MNTNNVELNPSKLLRYRDSVYATDLLICSIAYFDFFTFLKDRSWTFDDICEYLNISPRPAEVMLSLFLAMELILKTGTGYKLTAVSREYLVSDSPASLIPYYASLNNRPQTKEFREILITGKPSGWSSKDDGKAWKEAMRDVQFANSFTAAMDSRGSFLAQMLVQRLSQPLVRSPDMSRYKSLLDIAGGSGVYACSISQRYEHMGATVLEISPVDEAARRSIESKDMSQRVDVVAGDMFNKIPRGYDVHLFANVLHDWDMDSVKKLAANSFESLNADGLIIVFDAHLNEDKDGPLSVAEYSCLLMHSTEGRCYSTKEIGDILEGVGFTDIIVTEVAAERTMITGNKKTER
ncbi:MAG: methyltransferase [Desulfobacterium sp.]|nr:methyltransferase [Desulfobacterium sp.]